MNLPSGNAPLTADTVYPFVPSPGVCVCWVRGIFPGAREAAMSNTQKAPALLGLALCSRSVGFFWIMLTSRCTGFQLPLASDSSDCSHPNQLSCFLSASFLECVTAFVTTFAHFSFPLGSLTQLGLASLTWKAQRLLDFGWAAKGSLIIYSNFEHFLKLRFLGLRYHCGWWLLPWN